MFMKNRKEEILGMRMKYPEMSYSQIAKELKISKSLVAFYCNEKNNIEKIEKIKLNELKKKEYEELVCDVIRNSKNYNQVCVKLNKRPTNNTYNMLKKIQEKYNIDISHFSSEIIINNTKKLNISEIFSENSKLKNNSHLKEKLFKLGFKNEVCEKCGNDEWLGVKIPLQVHHINGNRNDNTITNLQLLCPNCHALTDNYCGKNKKKEKTKNEKIDTFKKSSKSLKFPSKETLIENFKEKGSFKGVGEVYNVSDNAVKKWFIKHNLPSTAKAVRDMIIEMYGKQPQWYSYMEGRDLSKSIEKRGYKIEVYNKNGEYLTTCRSILEASRFTNISKNTLAKYLKGEEIKNKEFIFKKI